MKEDELLLCGDKFGMLTIVNVVVDRDSSGVSRRRVVCLCDCGNISVPMKRKVLSGDTRSCGCMRDASRRGLGVCRRLGYGEAVANNVYRSYIRSAKHRGLNFDLTREDFMRMVVEPCVYCGDSLTNIPKERDNYGSFPHTGIDRVDNSIGYELWNCVPCCATCNRMKRDMTVKEFYDKINAIHGRSNMFQRTA